MTEAKRDGNWIDEWGACKVCGGEIPHGHTPNCDIFKLEQEASLLRFGLVSVRNALIDLRELVKTIPELNNQKYDALGSKVNKSLALTFSMVERTNGPSKT
jgi:hypothetical protein